jgi:hypothetical protein
LASANGSQRATASAPTRFGINIYLSGQYGFGHRLFSFGISQLVGRQQLTAFSFGDQRLNKQTAASASAAL